MITKFKIYENKGLVVYAIDDGNLKRDIKYHVTSITMDFYSKNNMYRLREFPMNWYNSNVFITEDEYFMKKYNI